MASPKGDGLFADAVAGAGGLKHRVDLGAMGSSGFERGFTGELEKTANVSFPSKGMSVCVP